MFFDDLNTQYKDLDENLKKAFIIWICNLMPYKDYLTFKKTAPLKYRRLLFDMLDGYNAIKKRNDILKKENFNKTICPQIFECYDEILEKTLLLSDKLHLDNSIQIANLFTYLLWNGFFSVSKTHTYSIENRNIIYGGLPFEIINGQGVCLNYSEMLTDLLNKKNNFSAMLILGMLNTPFKTSFIPDIHRNIKTESIYTKLVLTFVQLLTLPSDNHACTLICENNRYSIYDPTNLLLFEINNPHFNEAHLVNGEGSFNINFLDTSAFATTSWKSDMIANMYSNKKEAIYCLDDFINSWKDNMILFKDNNDLFQKFHNDIKNNIELIDIETKQNVLLKKRTFMQKKA